jgi:phospholipase C
MPSIEHVIVLVLENRSFDHLFGYSVDGPLGLLSPPPGTIHANIDVRSGAGYVPSPHADYFDLEVDPGHDAKDVYLQVYGGPNAHAPSGTTNLGFVQSYRERNKKVTDPGLVMRCFDGTKLTALQQLADAYTLCTRWHCSVPGPTWPNKFYFHCGTSRGMSENPAVLDILRRVLIDRFTFPITTLSWLEGNGRTWKIYEHRRAHSRSINPLHPKKRDRARKKDMHRFASVERFYEDLSAGPAHFPNYAYVEPEWLGRNQNDMHPHKGSDMRLGDKLVADIYNALRASDIWDKALLFITFDEHGGIYDHVTPPSAVPPGDVPPKDDLVRFDRLGPRVPALVVSRFAARKRDDTLYDHSSLISSLGNVFGLPVDTAFGQRATGASPFTADILGKARPKSDCPAQVYHSAPVTTRYDATAPLDAYQQGLVALALASADERRAKFAERASITSFVEPAADPELREAVSQMHSRALSVETVGEAEGLMSSLGNLEDDL